MMPTELGGKNELLFWGFLSLLLTCISLLCFQTIVDGNGKDGSWEWSYTSMWDDGGNFISNDMVQPPLTIQKIWRMLTETRINVYEPLSWVAKAMVVKLSGGVQPAALGIRRLTLCFHSLNGTLLMTITAHILAKLEEGAPQVNLSQQISTQGSIRFACCFVGALFYTVHPVHAEVVGWASAQPYAQCSTFTLLATFLYLRAHHSVVSKANPPGKKRWVLSLASTGCYICGLLSKAASVPWPVTCIAIELVLAKPLPQKKDRPWYRSLQTVASHTMKRCMFHGLAGVIFIFLTLFANKDGVDPHSDVIAFTLPQRIVKAQITMWLYVRFLFWPVGLRPHYTIYEEDLDLWGSPEALLSCLQFWTVSILVIMMFCRGFLHFHIDDSSSRYFWPIAAWGVYTAYFLPTCGLIQHGMVQKGGDRYAYLAYQPIALILAGLLYKEVKSFILQSSFWTQQCHIPDMGADSKSKCTAGADKEQVAVLSQSPKIKTSLLLMTFFVLFGPLMSGLIYLTNIQVQLWRSDEAMLLESIRIDPNDWRMLDIYAEFLAQTGRLHEAESFLNRASEATPITTAKGFLSKTKNLVFLGNYAEACDLYKKSLEKFPDSPQIMHNVAICQMIDRNYEAVHFTFQQALSLARTAEQAEKIQENFMKYVGWESSGFKGNYEGSIMW